ncbi:MAG TPA: hypothetical protein VJ720_15805, partial [Chitinophaga sp.]|nr:hypothetical protein [Chitinophaga sp.]
MQLMALKDDITAILSSYDGFESSKSFYEGGSIAVRFGQIISQVNTPVLLVIDTFEEAQFLGGEIVHGVWSLLVRLQEAAPNLRTIVGGRAMVQQFPVKPLELPELSREEVQELIAAVLKNSFNESELRRVVDDIISVAGMNPMSLRMALIIVQEQGVDKLRKVETRNWFMRRLRTEVIQARLYGRILTHIHNEKVKQLAYPGLIVRRITADVIREVLAGPCQLKLKNAGEADELTDLLANEASLVTRDPVDGALCHRQDVRRVMLQDLRNEISAAVIKAIHDNAVNYYSKQNDPIARAEEIYHRLSRGDSIQDVEKRWMPGIENRLRNALEELPSKSLLWLSGKLGVTPDKDMLKTASLGEWESITATAAERYLNTGEAQIALDTIRERDDRTTNSPLYRLELEALRNLGLYDEAAFVAEEMLATIPRSADPAILFEINMQAAFIKEAQGRIEEAIVYLRQASSLQSPEPTKEGLRILITHIRLLRKQGDEKNAERAVFVKQVRDWLADRQLLMSLSSSPALLREVVAELGKIMPELLENAIDWVGIEIRNDLQANVLSQALTNWNAELQKDSNSLLGELLERTGIKDNTLQSWNTFVKENNGRRLSNNIQHWRKELSSDLPGQSNGVSINFDNTLVDIYRINVDLSINRSSMEGGGMTVF